MTIANPIPGKLYKIILKFPPYIPIEFNNKIIMYTGFQHITASHKILYKGKIWFLSNDCWEVEGI